MQQQTTMQQYLRKFLDLIRREPTYFGGALLAVLIFTISIVFGIQPEAIVLLIASVFATVKGIRESVTPYIGEVVDFLEGLRRQEQE